MCKTRVETVLLCLCLGTNLVDSLAEPMLPLSVCMSAAWVHSPIMTMLLHVLVRLTMILHSTVSAWYLIVSCMLGSSLSYIYICFLSLFSTYVEFHVSFFFPPPALWAQLCSFAFLASVSLLCRVCVNFVHLGFHLRGWVHTPIDR